MKKINIKRISESLEKNKGIKRLKKLKEKIEVKVRTNLRYELVFLVGICFLISIIVGTVVGGVLFDTTRKIVKTDVGIEEFNSIADGFVENLQTETRGREVSIEDGKFFTEMLQDSSESVYVTDLEGKVIYKSRNGKEVQFSIFKLLSSLNQSQYVKPQEIEIIEGRDAGVVSYEPQIITRVYPLTVKNKEYYVIYEGFPQINTWTSFESSSNDILGFVVGVLVFVFSFIYVINKKVKYLDKISDEIKIIASGELSHRVEVRGCDEVSNIAENINLMASEIEEKIKMERKAEKTKAELITNVSHDLRTPLTSIMGYIGLLKDKRYKSEKEMEEYLNIAFKKSEGLKGLIEDLFEYTKLNNTEMKLDKVVVNLSSMVSQIVDEMTPVFEKNDLILVKNIVDDKILSNVDPDKMVRVFENILSNACKYSYKPGTVVMGIYENEGDIIISVRNRGPHIEKEKLDKLFERFYRGDESRNTESGGTGLGLAIARNIIKMHNGLLWAECVENDITFYIKLQIYRN
ncbi:MAG: sensor histidine kinase [Clostridium sp.]|uniref:sensor histidine kinase n=1 Tax=Clostridium sp. TaxID=1506 RepID=UPI003F379E75